MLRAKAGIGAYNRKVPVMIFIRAQNSPNFGIEIHNNFGIANHSFSEYFGVSLPGFLQNRTSPFSLVPVYLWFRLKCVCMNMRV